MILTNDPNVTTKLIMTVTKKRLDMKKEFPLNKVLFQLHHNENGKVFSKDFTTRDACANLSVIGSAGSAKTSGFCQCANFAFAKNEFAMVIPTAKNSEVKRYEDLASATNREEDLIIWGDQSGLKFDPLLYLSSIGKMDTQNIVKLFTSIAETIGRIGGLGSGFGQDTFWIKAVSRLIRHLITLLKYSKQEISFKSLNVLVSEMYAMKAQKNNRDTSKFPFLWKCRIKAQTNTVFNEDKEVVLDTLRFIEVDFMNLSEKTSSIISEMFYGMIDPFLHGTLKDVMVGEVSEELKPENVIKNGSILLINYPILEKLEIGAIIQTIYLRLLTEAIERRNLEYCERPVAVIMDEAHHFMADEVLNRALSTGREKRAIFMLASQSISGYYASMKDNKYKARVDAFMANCSTKVFCNSTDPETIDYYVKTIGKGYVRIQDRSIGNEKYFDSYRNYIEGDVFKKLKRGGEENNCIAESIILMPNLPDEHHYIKASFDQRLVEKVLQG